MEISKEVKNRNVDDLKSHSLNEKLYSDIEGVERAALFESIKQFGIQNPIVVTNEGVIISGHQRLNIAKELGFIEVPTVNILGTDEELEYFLVLDNKARRKSEKNLIKRARQYKVLWDKWDIKRGGDRTGEKDKKVSTKDIADSLDSSVATVRKHLRLLDLIDSLQSLVSKGAIGLVVGNRLAKLSKPEQIKAYKFIEKKGLTEITISDCDEILSLFENNKIQKDDNEEDVNKNSAPKTNNKIQKIEKQLEKWKSEFQGENADLFKELLLKFAAEQN